MCFIDLHVYFCTTIRMICLQLSCNIFLYLESWYSQLCFLDWFSCLGLLSFPHEFQHFFFLNLRGLSGIMKIFPCFDVTFYVTFYVTFSSESFLPFIPTHLFFFFSYCESMDCKFFLSHVIPWCVQTMLFLCSFYLLKLQQTHWRVPIVSQ